MKERYVAVECIAQAETDKAVCVSDLVTERGKVIGDIWMPKSVLHYESIDIVDEAVRGDEIELYVAEWWLTEKV